MMLPFLSLAFTFLFSDRSSQQASVYRQQGVLTSPSHLSAEQRARIEHGRQIAAEINDLAGRIHSEADSSALVDKIAALFADALPPAWATQGIRRRIAHAEYEAVTDASQLIPEQRIADVWNEYVREIGAPDETLVTTAELHNLRDADFATAQFLWPGGQNIWTVSSIYAVDSDGKLSDGCRPIEALRILYGLDMMFDNLRGARERVKRGILVSDELKKRQDNQPATRKFTAHLETRVTNNPVWDAERLFIQQHGPYVLNGVVEKLFDEVFPSID